MRKATTKKRSANGDRSRPKSRKRSVPAKGSNAHQSVPVEKPVSARSVRTQHTRKPHVSRDVANRPIDVQEVLGTLAGVTGGVLGVVSAVVAAPVALAASGIGAVGLGVAGALSSVGRNYYRAGEKTMVEVSHAVRGLAKSISNVSDETSVKTAEFDTDLKRREYRDELGQLHHHTHQYMRDRARK